MDKKKNILCKKILFTQDQISQRIRFVKYSYEYLQLKNVDELTLICNQLVTIRKKDLKLIDNQKIIEQIEEILDEICRIHYLEKYKCFIFRGEYENTPIIELVKYEDDELWEFMIPKELEEKYGIYNPYILNVMRYTLYRLYMDKFDSIRDMLRDEKAFDRYCDISFTLTINFFYGLLKSSGITIHHHSIEMMKKDVIEDYDKYVETNGVYDED